MDPNATLAEIRGLLILAAELEVQDKGLDRDDSARLVDLVESLDEWIRRGGALPNAWKDAYIRAVR